MQAQTQACGGASGGGGADGRGGGGGGGVGAAAQGIELRNVAFDVFCSQHRLP